MNGKEMMIKLILAGKSRADVARELNISGSEVCHIVSGRRNPSPAIRQKVEEYLDTLDGEADTFCKKVKLALLERDMTMSDLQKAMSVSRQALNYAMNGKAGYDKLTARVSSYLSI